jgi:glycosyltransferase involved in cell wall biosynthesis
MHTRKVWMIIPTFHPVIGGAQTQVRAVAKHLLANNRPVEVLARRHHSLYTVPVSKHDNLDGIPIRRIYSRTRWGSLLYLLGGLWHILWHGRHGIYHAHDVGAPGWLAVIAARMLGGYSIIKLRTGCQYYAHTKGWHAWQQHQLIRLADHLVVVSHEVGRFVLTQGVAQERVVYLPNGVDVDFYHPPSPREKVEARQRTGLPCEETIVLYVGRFAIVKGVDILLKGWALLPEDLRRHAKLVLVGDGPEHDALMQLGESLGISSSMMTVGEKKAVRDYYWAADLFVLCSRTEGLSNALVEAMACGVPPIASQVGGTPDIVEDAVSGWLFPSEDSHQLADKLQQILTQAEGWGTAGKAARTRMIERANLQESLERFLALYDQLR